MTGSEWLDVALLALAAGAAISGWIHGAAAAAFALLGVGIGATSGLLVAPHLVRSIDSPVMRLVAGLAIVVVIVVIGQVAGVTLGRETRRYITSPPARFVNSIVGAVLQAMAALLVAWLVAIPVSTQERSPLSPVIRGSTVLATIDQVAPDRLQKVPGAFTDLLGTTGFPDILGPFGSTPMREVQAPDPELVRDPVVDRVRPSVVKVLGRASRCQRALEGTGFLVGPGQVMTNAHVVAGTDAVVVESLAGKREARVVHYDSDVDIAVLQVEGLSAPALSFGPTEVPTGTDAVVVGFPGNGPYVAEPARIRETIRLRGPNIYRDKNVEREVYTLRGSVREGNSGGPVLDRSGAVIGVVFGAATDASDTGYALTVGQVRSHLDAARGASKGVPTGNCVGAA